MRDWKSGTKLVKDPAHEVVKPRLPCLKNTIAAVVEVFKLQTTFQTADSLKKNTSSK
jgi:hypothetical protein